MKKSILAFLFVGALTLSSCMKEPMACIEAPSSGTVGQSITFTSCSMDAHHVEWTFGDGATASESTTTHIYSAAGTYTVKLVAMSKNRKKSDEKTQVITIN